MKKTKLVEIMVSPSKAYLATQCMQWQLIESGTKLLKTAKANSEGIEKHAQIEKDLSIVKNWLPENYEKMEVYQEYALESEIVHIGYLLRVKGQADCIIFDKKQKKLFVYDWKTGGSQVEFISEEQLILYAYCAIEKFNELSKAYGKKEQVTNLELIYVNPDLNTSMTKNFSPDEIKEKVFEMIFKIGESLKKSYSVGEHCQNCNAKSACPEVLKQLKLLISPEVNGKEIEKFSEIQLDLIRIGEKVIEELKSRIKTYLTFNPDKTLQGYILADRKGIRAIRQDAELKIFAERLGVKVDELFEKQLLSIKKLEDKGLNLSSVDEFIYQPTSKVLKKI